MKKIHSMNMTHVGEAGYYLDKTLYLLDESYYGYEDLKKANELIKKVEKEYENLNKLPRK